MENLRANTLNKIEMEEITLKGMTTCVRQLFACVNVVMKINAMFFFLAFWCPSQRNIDSFTSMSFFSLFVSWEWHGVVSLSLSHTHTYK